MTTNEAATTRPRVPRARGRRTGIICLALLLALLAFLLLPTAHANLTSVASVNGMLVSIPPATTVAAVAADTLAVARPGSALDLTGDVVALGEGGSVKTEVDGRRASSETRLGDGSVVLVAHGAHALEGILAKEEKIPFKTVVEGSGAIVRLAQAGSPGKRQLYLGTTSRKQAAVFTIESPKNEIVKRSSAPSSGQKLVALTFDDGPGKWTQAVLDALAAKRVPATFFFLGSSAAGNKAMVQKVRDAGHEVENHSWSHPQLNKLTPDQIRNEIARAEAVLGKGRFLRPPYGAYNSTVTSVAASMGYRLALWTVDTLDWKNRDADAILAHVKAQTKPGGIILMHDGGVDRSQTVAAIPRVIDWLLANGYSLTTLKNLL